MNRVQRKRNKGYKLPPNTRCVTRGTKWGNPYKVVKEKNVWCVRDEKGDLKACGYTNRYEVSNLAKEMYRTWVERMTTEGKLDIKELAQYANLACFCPLDAPCHADVLIDLLNETK